MFKNVERIYKVVYNSLFGKGELEYDRVCDALIILCDLIGSTDEYLWDIGEGNECDLMTLVIDAYWHFSDWHNGQNSLSYQTLSSLGEIFNPGIDVPDRDSAGYVALEALVKRSN